MGLKNPILIIQALVLRPVSSLEMWQDCGHLVHGLLYFPVLLFATGLLKGSWDLVTRVIIKVSKLLITYNPN